MYLISLDGKLSVLSQWKDTRYLTSIQNFLHMDSLPGPSEGYLLTLNDPTFCLWETYSNTAGNFSARRASTSHVDICFA